MRFPRKAMVLAAGLGTRLAPLTDRVPKALLEIGGRPMIEYPLRMLAAAGVEEVVINLHHLGERIRAALGSGARYGLRIRYSPEDPILDTGGAIAHARPLLGDEPFAIANCDALLDPDLEALWRLHEQRGALATLVVRADPQAERYGALDLDPTGIVRRFLGKPATVDAPLERRMFCGVHVLSPAVFAHLPAVRVFSITRDLYGPLVVSGARLCGYDYRGYWRDLGTPDDLSAARNDLAARVFDPAYLRSY
ncbi:MAG TPA: NDP-sugar synthase [Candidatus Binatia bacterium]|nr:NDP-sugar synthase [Candidatus Binatia bacterium]